ncbi:MAG: ribonuclease III [Bacteroidales bacterium]|nr:ribonuclease III [Bacteroidales bacterium]
MFFFFGKKDEQSKSIKKFLKNILGVTPKNILLYKTALIHKSCSHRDSKGNKINNERLEYLGDTVLSTIVAHYLFKKYPHQEEGFLTEMRAKIVSRASLNNIAKKIGLKDLIEYNKNLNVKYVSMPGDAFEALTGALYLDKGFKKTYNVLIKRIISIYIDVEDLESFRWNYKSKIIDWVQKTKKTISFDLVSTTDVGHRNQYCVAVTIDGETYEQAVEFSIKAAEQLASEKTYKRLLEEGIIQEQ